MVDFILAPKLETELESTIQAKLVALAARKMSPTLHVSVNQVGYTSLTRSPATVSVETKVAGGNLEEGRMQLGIWTAALAQAHGGAWRWQQELTPATHPASHPDTRAPVVPLLRRRSTR